MHVRRILTLYKPNMFCACGSIAYVILLSNMSLIKLFLQPFEAAFFMLFITRL
nr:MAG TPA: hypothetical protein [Caudoviricetes sp.]DAZ54260.1 MAG TPA: hypothetical protein [Caudoviricetes sp.]